MTREEIEKQVVEIVCEQLVVRENAVTPDKYLEDDLGADQLDVVEIIMSLEEHFNIEIPCDDAETLTTVGKVIDYLQAKGPCQ